MTWHDRIKQLRIERELTQQEVADSLGVVRSSVANWEMGRRTPPIKIFQQLATLYRVPIAYIAPQMENNEAFDDAPRMEKVKSVPVVAHLPRAYADKQPDEDLAIGYACIDARHHDALHRYYYLEVQDDAISNVARAGDQVLIHRQRTVDADGQVSLILIEGQDEAVLRRVYERGPGQNAITVQRGRGRRAPGGPEITANLKRHGDP